MQFTSCDPGNNTGWAHWVLDPHGKPLLIGCGLAQEGGQKYPPLEGRPGAFLVEIPQVYAAQKSPGDPNDLIALAVLAGQYRERFRVAGAMVANVLPREWKGTISKDMCNKRTLIELERLPNASHVNFRAATRHIAEGLLHNTLDGVGIGLAAFRKGLWPR